MIKLLRHVRARFSDRMMFIKKKLLLPKILDGHVVSIFKLSSGLHLNHMIDF